MAEKFTTKLVWPTSGENRELRGEPENQKLHEVTTSGGVSFYSNPAPLFGGSVSILNPEELLLGALSSCQFLTFLSLAEKLRLGLVYYEDNAELYLNDDKVKFAEKTVLNLKMKFETPQSIEKVREICEKAHKYCIVGNSIKAEFALNIELID